MLAACTPPHAADPTIRTLPCVAPAANRPDAMATPRTARNRDATVLPRVGWREWITLPALLPQPLKAKIDTGARTSAVHAFDIREFRAHGRRRVEFFLHPLQRQRAPEVRCEADVFDQRIITSSNGQRDRRIVIVVDVSLGEARWPIELTLADRDQMGFRMLLGREALRGRFLVDPGRSFLQSRRPRATRTRG